MNNIWKLSLTFRRRLRGNPSKNMHFKRTFRFCFLRYGLVNSAIAVLTRHHRILNINIIYLEFCARHAHLLTTFDPGRKLYAYALRRFEFQYLGVTWLWTKLYAFHFDQKITDSFIGLNHFAWECNKSHEHGFLFLFCFVFFTGTIYLLVCCARETCWVFAVCTLA